MTFRQVFLKAVYPLIMFRNKLFPHAQSVQLNVKNAQPRTPFHELVATANNGDALPFEKFRGKKVLLVNTASNCGFTGQYAELETLYQKYRDTLVVLGFPANDFKEQEQLNDAEIAQFCEINYGVHFPLIRKSQVVKGAHQNTVFNWLTHAEKNGWCSQQPLWNFCKYLVDEKGKLVAFFAHTISPLQKDLEDLIR